MAETPIRDDTLTLIAAGVLGVTLATLSHEALGHGGACLAQGGEITRLTAIKFQCDPGSNVTDAAGPVAQFVVGFLAVTFMRLRPSWRPAVRFPLLIVAAVSLLWFSAQLMRDALVVSDDWAFSGGTWWRWLLVVGGLMAYMVSMSWLVPAIDDLGAESGPWALRRLLIPYAAAAVAAGIAAALWPVDRLGSALDMLSACALAPLGYVIYAIRARRRLHAVTPAYPVPRSWGLIAAAAVLYGAWAAILGPGFPA